MKRILIIILLCLLAVDGATLIYLKQRQNKAEERIKGSILSELQNKKRIEEPIMQQIDSRKWDKLFVTQLEYERLLEDFAQQLEEFKTALEEFQRRNNEEIKLLKENIKDINNFTLEFKGEFKQKLEEYQNKSESTDKEFKENFRQLEEHTKELNGLIDGQNKKLQILGRQLKDVQIRLKEYKEELQEQIRNQQAENDRAD